MPHIRIRGMSDSEVKTLSIKLPVELAKVLSTPEDNFTVEKVATEFYKSGAPTQGDPMIEILWFDRGQEIKNAAAKLVTELVRGHTNSEFIAVVFSALPKSDYYENGDHF